MRTRIAVFSLFLLSFVMSSCSRRDPQAIYLTGPLPSGIVSQTGALRFAFSRTIVPPESTNVWMNTSYVEFTPAIEGKFVWQDTSVLIFSPDAALPGDTKFKGRINGKLLALAAHATSYKGDEDFSFSTEPFTLKSAEFFYDRIDNKRNVGIKANLEFTYAVNPEEVGKYIKLKLDGDDLKSYKIMSSVVQKVIPIEIGTVIQYDKEREVKVSFDDKLTSSETKTQIKLDKPFVYKLPALEDLKIYGHEFGFDGTESWIKIKTSQEIDIASVKQYIVIDPSRSYTIEPEAKLSFRIKGKFEPGAQFHLVLKKGLESVLGGKTKNDYEADIVIGNVAPSFRFASVSGAYMLLSGSKSIELKTVNLSELRVRVSEIFQNNLVHFIDGGRSYDYYGEDEDGGWYNKKYRYYLGNNGRVIEEKKIEINNSSNQEVTTSFDLSPYIQTDYKGFYLIEIAKADESWRWTSKLVSLSNIGLIVKRSEQELIVFAVSLENNKPLSGVRINLISTNNQTMASSKTDGDGVAKFYNFEELSRKFSLKLITAEEGDDFNFINLADYQVETSRFDVSGKSDIRGIYDAFLYGDRNLYRPGEKIYVSGIIRNLTNALPENMPVKIKIYDPRGYIITEVQRKLNEQGSFEINYQTLQTAQTGEYRFDLHTGDDIFLTSYKVSVEDFVPDRLRVLLKASEDTVIIGQKVQYELTALNFFGPPAANRNVEFEATMEQVPFYSRRFPEFRFSNDEAGTYTMSPYVEKLQTDKDGKGSISFSVPDDATASGALSLKGLVSVFDESGRPVHQVVRTLVFPNDYFIGVRSYLDYYVAPNSQLKIQLVAVDQSDKTINDFTAHVDIIRHEWHSVLRMNPNTNSLRYVSEQREIVEQSNDVNLGNKPTDFVFSVQRSGDYIIRVSKAGESGYNQIGFYAYSWGSTDLTSFEINPEARVDIVLDKKVYAPGDKARVLFQTPFSGKLLVTVERNKVFTYKYLDVEKNSASMNIDIEDSFLPNVYVSAVLFRKVKDMNIPLMSGHGFEPLMVEKKSNKLNISIEAPEKIRPRMKQKITVRIPDEKNVFLTLAAVDEGICQVKNYRTPDPYSYFYAKKSLETGTFDFFRDLIPEPNKKSSTGGGDFEAKRALQVNPLSVKRFKPVALWSGIIKTNSDGNADVTFDVPDFNGELRLMALAYKKDAFGSSQKAMKVADPVVLSPALPRFLSPGDVITMPVTVFNTTNSSVSLKLEIITEGSIKAVQQNASLDIKGNGEGFVNITLKASEQVGKAVVKVRTYALGEKLESVTELAVRPISPFVTETTNGFAEAGKTVTVDIPDVFHTFNRRGHVVLSPFPVANFAKQLKDLVGYPHGCLEQTTSKAFPQIYLRDIAAILDPSIIDKGSPTYFVNEAINKITGMQLANGSFSYWPGGDYSNDWSTVYATHFLVEAKKAGYSVSDAVVNSALNFIRSVARKRDTYDYYYYENNKTVVKRIADKTSIYALYILALAGQPEKTLMNFYRTSKQLLTNDTEYLLAGAFALSGDRKAYLEIIPPMFASEEARRTSGGCFDSPIRAAGIMLNVLLESDPNNSNIARYMEYISALFKKYYWYTTQEEAFALCGFGKAARKAGGVKVRGTVTIGSKQTAYDGGNKRIPIEQFEGKVTIALQGEGRIYYSVVQEGIRKDGQVRIEDKNLRIRRQFFDRWGNVVGLDGIKQNSMIIVKLTLQSDIDQLENVAISDLLPAGFEIENPRLTENSEYSFTSNASTPVYLDIRDDRINYYTNFGYSDRDKTFYYVVRAVTRGEFNYAPVVGEAMYDGDYYSASGGGKIRIVE